MSSPRTWSRFLRGPSPATGAAEGKQGTAEAEEVSTTLKTGQIPYMFMIWVPQIRCISGLTICAAINAFTTGNPVFEDKIVGIIVGRLGLQGG